MKAHPEEYRDQKNPPRRINQIKDAFGERRAAELKSSEIEEWLDSVQEDRELSNATINKLRGTFSMIYKHGKREDLTNVNPVADVPLRAIEDTIARFLSVDEEKRLRAVLEARIADNANHPVLRDEALERLLEFDISIRSGMRKSEQFNLRWPDINFKRRITRLRKTKNGKPRNAFLINDTVRALKQLREIYDRRIEREQKQGIPRMNVCSRRTRTKSGGWQPSKKRRSRITAGTITGTRFVAVSFKLVCTSKLCKRLQATRASLQ